MDTGVTSQLLADINNSKQIQDTSKNSIVALVERRRYMEKTFISKMDRDFEMRSEEAATSVETMLATVNDQLDKMRNSCNTELIEINNK